MTPDLEFVLSALLIAVVTVVVAIKVDRWMFPKKDYYVALKEEFVKELRRMEHLARVKGSK